MVEHGDECVAPSVAEPTAAVEPPEEAEPALRQEATPDAAGPIGTSWPASSREDRARGIVRPRLSRDDDFALIVAGFVISASGFVYGIVGAALFACRGVPDCGAPVWSGVPGGGAALAALLAPGGYTVLTSINGAIAGGLQLVGILMVIGAAANPGYDARAFEAPITASAGPDHAYVGWTQRF